MKTKLNNFIGIDVSKKKLDVFDGRKSYQIQNNLTGFNRLIQKTKPEDHFVMEATGSYHVKLAYYLHNKGIKVSVVNPLSVKRFSQMKFLRAKTDKVDAILLRDYALINKPEIWKVPQGYVFTIKQIQTAIDLLIKGKTSFQRQLEAFDQLPICDVEVIKLIKNQISQMDMKIRQLEDKAEQLVIKNAGEQYRVLKSIPGIGNKAAIMFIAITNEFKNFSNSKQLSSYIGICPRIYQSGTSVNGKGHICKMGGARMRSLLFMCSLTAKSCNQACKQLYDRLIQKGKSKKLALVAVMNKLVKQAFAIATKLVKYDKSKYNCELNAE
ncbi:MAG: IS110 family transposase [Bacteroidia bacterium]|nr:IS110 family transposase [Bacteroidia bacterium]